MLRSIILVPALLAGALAAPNWGPWGGKQCLKESTVQTLIDGYTYLLRFPQGANFNATANAILSDTAFNVVSDSINTLAGIPVSCHAHNVFQALGEFVFSASRPQKACSSNIRQVATLLQKTY